MNSNNDLVTMGDLMSYCLNSIKAFNDIGGNLDKDVDPVLERKLLKEEVDEYFKGVIEDNHLEVKDGLADIFFVLWGTICKHKLEGQFFTILKAVCDSNNTKWCQTEEEAKATVDHYKDLDVVATYELNPKYNVYVIKNKAGKILKSINFKKPVL